MSNEKVCCVCFSEIKIVLSDSENETTIQISKTPQVMSHLVSEGQVRKHWQVLGPLHWHKEQPRRGLVNVFGAGRVQSHVILWGRSLWLIAGYINVFFNWHRKDEVRFKVLEENRCTLFTFTLCFWIQPEPGQFCWFGSGLELVTVVWIWTHCLFPTENSICFMVDSCRWR